MDSRLQPYPRVPEPARPRRARPVTGRVTRRRDNVAPDRGASGRDPLPLPAPAAGARAQKARALATVASVVLFSASALLFGLRNWILIGGGFFSPVAVPRVAGRP